MEGSLLFLREIFQSMICIKMDNFIEIGCLQIISQRVQLLFFPVVRHLWFCGVLNAFRRFELAIALKSLLSEKQPVSLVRHVVFFSVFFKKVSPKIYSLCQGYAAVS